MTVKKNLLPLADPVSRARSHLDDLTAEEPMLIHPSDEEPSALIGDRMVTKEEFAAF